MSCFVGSNQKHFESKKAYKNLSRTEEKKKKHLFFCPVSC